MKPRPLPKRMSTISNLSQQENLESNIESKKRGTVYENYQSSTSDDGSIHDQTPPSPALLRRETGGNVYENYQSTSTSESSDEELKPTSSKMTEQGDSNATHANYTIPQRKTDMQEASDSDLSTDVEPDYINHPQKDKGNKIQGQLQEDSEAEKEITDKNDESDLGDENDNYKKRLSAHQSLYSTFTIPGVDFSEDIERFNKGVTHDTSYSLSDTDLDEKTSDHELYDTIKFG